MDVGSTTIREKLGHWNSLTGFVDVRTTKILSRRRSDLRGKELILSVVIPNNDTINHLTDYK